MIFSIPVGWTYRTKQYTEVPSTRDQMERQKLRRFLWLMKGLFLPECSKRTYKSDVRKVGGGEDKFVQRSRLPHGSLRAREQANSVGVSPPQAVLLKETRGSKECRIIRTIIQTCSSSGPILIDIRYRNKCALAKAPPLGCRTREEQADFDLSPPGGNEGSVIFHNRDAYWAARSEVFRRERGK